MNTTKDRQCEGKRAYSKKSKAKRMLDGLIQSGRHQAQNHRVRMKIYKCQYCKMWHVGHIRRLGF